MKIVATWKKPIYVFSFSAFKSVIGYATIEKISKKYKRKEEYFIYHWRRFYENGVIEDSGDSYTLLSAQKKAQKYGCIKAAKWEPI